MDEEVKDPIEEGSETLAKAIEELKARADAAEKEVAELRKLNEEQEAALSALLDGKQRKQDSASAAFFRGLRHIKIKEG